MIRGQKATVIILISGAFLTVMNQTLITPAIPPIMEELHINATIAQWLVSGFTLVNAIVAVVSAFLMEKLTPRKLFISIFGLDESRNVDPYKLTFVYKTGFVNTVQSKMHKQMGNRRRENDIVDVPSYSAYETYREREHQNGRRRKNYITRCGKPLFFHAACSTASSE